MGGRVNATYIFLGEDGDSGWLAYIAFIASSTFNPWRVEWAIAHEKWHVVDMLGQWWSMGPYGCSKNTGKTSQIIHFNRVFHYFHHPCWDTPIFGNTHMGPFRSQKIQVIWYNPTTQHFDPHIAAPKGVNAGDRCAKKPAMQKVLKPSCFWFHMAFPFLRRSLILMAFLEATNATLSASPMGFSRVKPLRGCTSQSHPGTNGEGTPLCVHVPQREHGSWFPSNKKIGIWGQKHDIKSIHRLCQTLNQRRFMRVCVVVGYPPIAWNQEPGSHPRRTSWNLDGSRVRKLHYQRSNSKSVPHGWRGFHPGFLFIK